MYARNPSYSSETGGGVRSSSCPLRIQVAVAQPAKEEAPDRKGLSSSGQTLVEFSLFFKKKNRQSLGSVPGLDKFSISLIENPTLAFQKANKTENIRVFTRPLCTFFDIFRTE